MRKIVTTLILSCSFFVGISQTIDKTNSDLQLLLDSYQQKTGNGADVSIRKINEHLKTFDQQKQENDSLQLLVALLKADLLMAQGEIARCASIKESLAVTPIDKSNHQQGVDANLNGLSAGTINLQKGNYVIIESERRKEDIIKKLVVFQKKFSGYDLMIIKNKIQTWFHICLSEPFEQHTVGKKVALIRKKGIINAWSIILE